MYESNLYQRVKSTGYRIGYRALPVIASLYLSGCPDKASKVTITIEEKDGTIEEIVVDKDDIITCTEEDIFGKKRQNQPK